ncbi:hypothetical protein [Actinocorallia longicatena]|uniref:Mce-associated membrane protein n=1 Tax=Actinocorallia longicatena TaxID=111803 RepID=A0ABP6Q170_9ACTN
MREAFGLLAAVLLTGCAAGAEEFRPAGTPPAAPVASPAADDRRGSVLAAYREFQRVFESALATNDPGEIASVAGPPVAGNLIAQVERQGREGVVRRSHSALNPRIVRIRRGRAEVLDCVTASGFSTYDAGTGRRLPARPVRERGLLHATLRDHGGWKVVGLELLERRC